MRIINNLKEKIREFQYWRPILMGTSIASAFGGAALITGTTSYISYERITGPSKYSTIETIAEDGLPTIQLNVLPNLRADIPYIEKTPKSGIFVRLGEYLESIDKGERERVKSSILEAIKRHRR